MTDTTLDTSALVAGLDPAAIYALYKAARDGAKEVEALRAANLSDEGSEFLTALADVVPTAASTTGKAWVGGSIRGLTGVDSDGRKVTFSITVTDVSRTEARNAVVKAVTGTFPDGTKASDPKLVKALIAALAAHESGQADEDDEDGSDEE